MESVSSGLVYAVRTAYGLLLTRTSSLDLPVSLGLEKHFHRERTVSCGQFHVVLIYGLQT